MAAPRKRLVAVDEESGPADIDNSGENAAPACSKGSTIVEDYYVFRNTHLTDITESLAKSKKRATSDLRQSDYLEASYNKLRDLLLCGFSPEARDNHPWQMRHEETLANHIFAMLHYFEYRFRGRFDFEVCRRQAEEMDSCESSENEEAEDETRPLIQRPATMRDSHYAPPRIIVNETNTEIKAKKHDDLSSPYNDNAWLDVKEKLNERCNLM